MNVRGSNSEFKAGGYYAGAKDIIVANPNSLVHELGHAVDYQGVNNINGKNNYSKVLSDQRFLRAYNIGLKRFIAAGNKKYDYDDKSTWNHSRLANSVGISNYCTANPKELWAEVYTALMTGSSNSSSTIKKYFPEALEVGKTILNETRNSGATARHNTTRREFLSSLD